MMKTAFDFTLKAFFLKIFDSTLSFGQVEKTAWLER